MKKRYPEFDVAKAIALAGVIIGHSTYLGTPDRLASIFYSFDMPLFFIVSGFFSKPEAKLTPDYVKKNVKSLLMPYLITCIGVIGCSFLEAALTGKTNPIEIANHWFMASLYGCGGITPATPAFVSAIGALWYLFALFFGKMLLTVVNQFRHPTILVLGFFFCGNVLAQIFWLPWSILQALSATLFLYIGQIIRKHALLDENSIEPICWLFMVGIWGYSGLRFGKLYMVTNTYVNGTQDVIGSIFGSLVILKLCQMACKHIPRVTKPIAWIGKYTLPLFCMHLIELNVFPYQYVSGIVENLPLAPWIGYLIIRFAIIALLTGILYALPRPISKWYFQSKQKSTTGR